MNQRVLRFAGVALVAILGFWAGTRFYSTRMTARVPAAGMKVPAGESSAPTASDLAGDLATAPPAIKIPDRLPEFSLPDRDGKSTSIKAWEGKSLIINFWATWCAPCRREIPLLETLHSEWSGRGIEVIGIAVDYREKVLAYAKEFQVDYPLLIGEQDALNAAAAFGVESPAFPFTVFTDRRGEVVALYLGELHRAQVDLILSVVQNLNQNAVALPEARDAIREGLRIIAATPTPG
jgi:thiol-disulfide isomerase/thioredoxin